MPINYVEFKEVTGLENCLPEYEYNNHLVRAIQYRRDTFNQVVAILTRDMLVNRNTYSMLNISYVQAQDYYTIIFRYMDSLIQNDLKLNYYLVLENGKLKVMTQVDFEALYSPVDEPVDPPTPENPIIRLSDLTAALSEYSKSTEIQAILNNYLTETAAAENYVFKSTLNDYLTINAAAENYTFKSVTEALQTRITTVEEEKADLTEVYTTEEANDTFAELVDLTALEERVTTIEDTELSPDNYYTKTDADAKFATVDDLDTVEASLATLETEKANIPDVYTKAAADSTFATVTTVTGIDTRVTAAEGNITTLNTNKLSDAPADGTSYGRKDGAWAAVTAA